MQHLQAQILSSLNEQQKLAVSHGVEPLLIIAGAGTGKTTTLAHRVAWLIASGVDPGRMLLLTFTRRSAADMLRRVDGILKKVSDDALGLGLPVNDNMSSKRVWSGTFHAIATRLLRRHGQLLSIPNDFTIMDRGDSEDLLNLLRTEMNLAKSEKKFPGKGTCLDIYSRCVNSSIPVDEALEKHFPWCAGWQDELKKLFSAYTDRKEKQAVLDYDDLLLFWHALVSEPATGNVIRERFDCVLVDEYQDTNILQGEILKHLCPGGVGLTVVGDDAQSIYAFRGATVKNILQFPDVFPETSIVTLEENYRSAQSILDVSNQILAEAEEGHPKQLWSSQAAAHAAILAECQDEDAETEFIVETVMENLESGIPLKEQAVLFRSSYQCMMLETELTRRGIPFQKYGGLRFIETAHVKDLMAFLKLAENPRDAVAGQRALVLLPGVGAKKAQQLMSQQLETGAPGFHVWDHFKPPSATREIWPDFLALMKFLAKPDPNRSVPDEVAAVTNFYSPLMEKKYDQTNARLRDLQQLEQVAARFPDRMTFLSEITLDPPSSTLELQGAPPEDSDHLILSTIHSAKGLEWNVVFVQQVCDGALPSQRSIGSIEELEEERRLLYVALTRPRHQLYVCHPQRVYLQNRYRGDAYGFSPLSRFISPPVQQLLERHIHGEEESLKGTPAAPPVNSSDIRDRLKKNWF